MAWLEAVQFGDEVEAKCGAMVRLELTLPDGKTASVRGRDWGKCGVQ